MNRKERRAARKRGQGAGASPRLPDIAAGYAKAVRHHQRGESPAADALSRAILVREPAHVGSLHLLGMIAQERGAHEEAVSHFRAVTRLQPDIADAHDRLGHALAQLGRIDEAIRSIERARALHAGVRQAPDYARTYLNLGNLCMGRGRQAEAAMLYERALALNPGFAEAHNNLGALLVEQGRLGEASAQFSRALGAAPELAETYSDLCATLFAVNPAMKQAVTRAADAWPRRLPIDELLGSSALAAVAGDPLLLAMLEHAPVRNVGLERALTSLRAALLEIAAGPGPQQDDAAVLGFACAVAQQCFINEYVFADSPQERALAEALRGRLNTALQSDAAISSLWPAVVGSYFPLGASVGRLMLQRQWPSPVERLLTQQIREPEQEREFRATIPRLTAIGGEVSRKVQQQYEENPYPRWVVAASAPQPRSFDEYLQERFPASNFRALGGRGPVEVLVAGCGTGQHPISMAQTFRDARVLAVDLSLASLSYAIRKTRELGLGNVEYAQADLLELGSIGRTFDVVDASGVLHHLADPMAGWRMLLTLLRPNGIMGVGLYSELARRDVVAAQRFVAERGYRPIADDIRRCRHELSESTHKSVAGFHDFFTTSGCRDFLFHVQEHRHTIPEIHAFLREQGLNFIGFEIRLEAQRAYRDRFPEDPAMRDLDRWHRFETERPATFAEMYQFWCQRN
jgi:Tfp pilus assembly protein PilF/SAM-dependent methyltransferase